MAEWRPIPGYEGRYDVSDDGRVRSYWRQPWRSTPQRILRPMLETKAGYPAVVLCDGQTKRRIRIHRLVLEAFVGPRPAGLGARHLNGNPADCRLSNLVWGTQAENMADSVRHTTSPKGVRHGMAKLTEDDVREIRRLLASGAKQIDIAARFGVTDSAVREIKTGRNWGWLDAS